MLETSMMHTHIHALQNFAVCVVDLETLGVVNPSGLKMGTPSICGPIVPIVPICEGRILLFSTVHQDVGEHPCGGCFTIGTGYANHRHLLCRIIIECTGYDTISFRASETLNDRLCQP